MTPGSIRFQNLQMTAGLIRVKEGVAMSSRISIPPEREFPSRRLVARRSQLVEEIALAGESSQPRMTSARWLRFGAASIALAVAALGIGAILQSRDGAQAQAAEVLTRAAKVADRQLVSKPVDRYRYTKVEGASLVTIGDGLDISALVPVVTETWVAPDGSGRVLSTTEQPVFLSPADKSRWEAAGEPALSEAGRSDVTYPPGGLVSNDVDSLPTDPDKLFEVIQERAANKDVPAGAEMLVIVGDLLSNPAASPDLRAALYRVAARIPSIELLGQTTDPAGRPGLGVTITSDYSGALARQELIFDPRDSELLGEREVLLQSVPWLHSEPPTVIAYSTYVDSGFVASSSERR
jgi:hypothetical protein